MGCLKITYNQQGEPSPFLGVWKKDRLEESDPHFFEVLSEKRGQQKNRINYYPFGMAFNSYERTASVKNRFNTFQDQEYEEETGWVEFRWRNHDPAIGRFFNIDPIAEGFYHNSPYAFSENKVTSHVELEGLEAWEIKYMQTPAQKTRKINSKDKAGPAIGYSLAIITAATVASYGGIGAVFEAIGSAIIGEATSSDTPDIPDPTPDEPQPDTPEEIEGARTEPQDLQEQLTLEEAKGGEGEEIMKGRLKDPKYDPETGTHDKIGHNHDHGDGSSTEVHYDRDRKTGEGSNYKIKDDTNKKSRGNTKKDETSSGGT